MAKTRTPRPRKAASVASLFTYYLSRKSPSARQKLARTKSVSVRRPKARKTSAQG